jgi:hypothetical protein
VIRAKVIGKGVIHPSGAQDNTGADYIRPNWPEIRYGNGGGAVGVGLSYNAQSTAADVDKVYYSAEWMRENISSKGTFGTLQRVWGDGKQMEKGAWKDGARRTAEIRPSTRRMTWAITPTYADANHYPIVALKSAKLSGKPGEVVNVSATIRDPDNDRVSVTWWPFENNGTYAGAVTLNTTEGLTTSFRIPADAKPGDTIHIIAEANDDGMRSLTRYARAVVTVK